MSNAMQAILRVVALVIIVGSLVFVVSRTQLFVDATAEDLHSVSDTTMDLLERIREIGQPVRIEAYISEDLPDQFELTRSRLERLFDALNSYGQANPITVVSEGEEQERPLVYVETRITETVGDSAVEAQEAGIAPRAVTVERGGRVEQQQVYMGLVVKAMGRQEVLPFVSATSPFEFQVMRGVASAVFPRKTVGIVNNELQVNGGFDFNNFSQRQPWLIVEELGYSYDVEMVEASQPVSNAIDVLVVPMLSNLSQDALDNVTTYVEAGRPALILDDPLLISRGRFNESASFDRPRGNPFNQANQQEKPPKGDWTAFYCGLDVQFAPFVTADMRQSGMAPYVPCESRDAEAQGHRVVWYNATRFTRLRNISKLVALLTEEFGDIAPHPVTEGLYEVVLLGSGDFTPLGDEDSEWFTPLLQTSGKAGEIVVDNFFASDPNDINSILSGGPQFRLPPESFFRRVREVQDLDEDGEPGDQPGYVVAALVERPLTPMSPDAEAGEGSPTGTTKLILVADVDMMGDDSFLLARQDTDRDGKPDLPGRNPLFIGNAIDYLLQLQYRDDLLDEVGALLTQTQRTAFAKALVEEPNAGAFLLVMARLMAQAEGIEAMADKTVLSVAGYDDDAALSSALDDNAPAVLDRMRDRFVSDGLDDLSEENYRQLLIERLDILNDESFATFWQAYANDPAGILMALEDLFLEDANLEYSPSMIPLRSKVAKPRPLGTIESAKEEFAQARHDQLLDAQEDLEQAITDAQTQLEADLANIRRTRCQDLPEIQCNQLMRGAQERLQREADQKTAEIRENVEREQSLQRGIQVAEEERLQQGVRLAAVLPAPIIALVVGIIVFITLRVREVGGVPSSRRRKQGGSK